MNHYRRNLKLARGVSGGIRSRDRPQNYLSNENDIFISSPINMKTKKAVAPLYFAKAQIDLTNARK